MVSQYDTDSGQKIRDTVFLPNCEYYPDNFIGFVGEISRKSAKISLKNQATERAGQCSTG